MDRPTPLENHAYYYKQRSGKGLWFIVPPLALFLARLIALQRGQQQIALLFGLGFIAYILLAVLLVAVIGGLLSRVRNSRP